MSSVVNVAPGGSLGLTLLVSDAYGQWRFKDSVFVEEELDAIELETIRAACNQQSRTQWTAIASRQRLYQFMAMSDEVTQKEMRQRLSTNTCPEGSSSVSRTAESDGSLVLSDTPSRTGGTKR